MGRGSGQGGPALALANNSTSVHFLERATIPFLLMQANCSDIWPSAVDRPTAMAAKSTWLQWMVQGSMEGATGVPSIDETSDSRELECQPVPSSRSLSVPPTGTPLAVLRTPYSVLGAVVVLVLRTE